MTLLNNDAWKIFCVFSSPEFYKTKSYNVIASIFITKCVKFQSNISNCLVDYNFEHVFEISSYISEPIRKDLMINGKKFTYLNCNLDYLLLEDGILIKGTLNTDLISKSVFVFNDIKWKDICKAFLQKNIIISGGSSTKRHIVSPIHFKLINVLNCFGYNYLDIVTSFDSLNKDIAMPKENISTPKKDTSNEFLVSNVNKKSIRRNKKVENGLVHSMSNINTSFNEINVNNVKGSIKNFSSLSINYNSNNKMKADYSFYLDSIKEIVKEVNNDPIKALTHNFPFHH
jgi:hypothetical protein